MLRRLLEKQPEKVGGRLVDLGPWARALSRRFFFFLGLKEITIRETISFMPFYCFLIAMTFYILCSRLDDLFPVVSR